MMLATGIVMAGVSLMSILYLQSVRGLSPLQSGLWLIPQNVAMALGMVVSPGLAQRIRPAYLMAARMLVAGFGLLLQTRTGADGGVAAVVVGLTLAGLGISPAMALTTNLILGSAPPEKAGSAASISETSGEFGIAVGVATLGSLATVVYPRRPHHPCGNPVAAEDAARQGIIAAAGVAQHLPGSLGAELPDAARTAFTAGLTTVAGVGAAVFIALAVLAAVAFRNQPRTGTAPEVQVDADESPFSPVSASV